MKPSDGGSDAWSRIKHELELLRSRWLVILGGLIFQYVHGIFTQLAYRMHKPTGQPLHDIGFELIPELPASLRWISEAIFTTLLLSFIMWTFTPLVCKRDFKTVILWTRLLTVLVVCQCLRILSFTSTQLPGPAPHCHVGQLTATKPQVSVWWQHLVVDVSTQVATSCGDLIFSSHMTFILTGILAYQRYGSKLAMKAAAWLSGLVLALLIISARKHYTVDVVIAWYTVPMVFTLLHIYWQRQQQQYSLLPVYRTSSDISSSSAYSSKCVIEMLHDKGSKQKGRQQSPLQLPLSYTPVATAAAGDVGAPAAASDDGSGVAVATVVNRSNASSISPRKQQEQRYIEIVASWK